VAAGLGARATLIWAGILGAMVTFAPVLSRRVRRLDDARRLPVERLHARPGDRLGAGVAD